ncbi:hypothetical protein ACOZ38_29510 [Sphaerisporangium viridialbum]|uniref:hypothetical protein n=1 Tax=Sphaerisporangium viridialbum TaxID=46189 RepID=UPI003C713EA2
MTGDSPAPAPRAEAPQQAASSAGVRSIGYKLETRAPGEADWNVVRLDIVPGRSPLETAQEQCRAHAADDPDLWVQVSAWDFTTYVGHSELPELASTRIAWMTSILESRVAPHYQHMLPGKAADAGGTNG